MALYDDVIASIVAYVKDNANGEIGGNGLQNKLTTMVTALGTNSHLMGFITAAKNMGAVPNTKQFWIALNNTSIPYSIGGVGLSNTSIQPGNIYIVHNVKGYWDINNITANAPLGLFGIISTAQNIGTVPINRGFYVAFNSSNNTYAITGSGSFSLSVAQNAIYIIHNLDGIWSAVNVATGIVADIDNTISIANAVRNEVNDAFFNMLTRGCITLCLPSAGADVLAYVKGAIRIDRNNTLDIFAKPDELEKITDITAVPINDSLVSRIHIASSDIDCGPGINPYDAIPNCIIVEGSVYKITRISDFWGKTRNLVLNVPHFVALEKYVINELLANNGKLVVHTCLLSAYQQEYQQEYPSLNVVSMDKVMNLYATANA